MIFTHNNQEFRIVFMHPTEVHGKGKRKHTTQHTICRIYTGARDTPEDVMVCHGAVTKYALDPFNKEEARIKALTEALVDYTDSCFNNTAEERKTIIGIFDAAYLRDVKAFRTAAWKAYHERPGGMYEPVNGLDVEGLVKDMTTLLTKIADQDSYKYVRLVAAANMLKQYLENASTEATRTASDNK